MRGMMLLTVSSGFSGFGSATMTVVEWGGQEDIVAVGNLKGPTIGDVEGEGQAFLDPFSQLRVRH